LTHFWKKAQMKGKTMLSKAPFVRRVIAIALFSVAVFHSGLALAQEGVVARVGETAITESDLAAAEALFASQTADMSDEARRSLLVDNLIDLELIIQAAEEDGLREDSVFKERAEFLAKQTLRSLYLERRLAETLSDDAVQREYDRLIAQMPDVAEIRPRHILVADKDAAETAIARLDDGESFAEVARDVSLDEATKQEGGDLGFVAQDAILKEIGDAATLLEPGEYTSEPVQSAFGFHIVFLVERRDRPAPDMAAVAPQIRQGLHAAAMQALTEELAAKTSVEKLVPDVDDESGDDGYQH
jgi:peptidyl-prolyl cis-trans isomerase C